MPSDWTMWLPVVKWVHGKGPFLSYSVMCISLSNQALASSIWGGWMFLCCLSIKLSSTLYKYALIIMVHTEEAAHCLIIYCIYSSICFIKYVRPHEAAGKWWPHCKNNCNSKLAECFYLRILWSPVVTCGSTACCILLHEINLLGNAVHAMHYLANF